jgi:signal transduction histidine kinase
LGVSDQYTIFAAGTVVIIYSAFGGMRSVAFTDVIQFFTFGVLIPVLGLILWNEYISINGFSFEHATQSPLFDYREFTGLNNPKFWDVLFLFLIFLNPGFHPSLYQKITMGRNVAQVKKAFTISALLLLLILLAICWIGFLIFNINPNLAPETLVHYIINNYSHTGLKGFILIGIVAMCMSKADTNLNSASVILTHDFFIPLGLKPQKELFFSKIISIVLGFGAMFLASMEYDLLSLILLVFCFNLPLVQPPLLLAILGWRTTERCVLLGMFAGCAGLLLWSFLMNYSLQDSIFHGIIANAIVLVLSHYILKEPGGWVGIKNQNIVVQARFERKRKWLLFYKSIVNFNFVNSCKSNAPKNELTYSGFGIFSLVSTICIMYSTTSITIPLDKNILLFFYETMLIISVSFMTYPIWPSALKKETVVQVIWIISVLYVLVMCSTFFVMLSNFSHTQLIILMVNLMIVAILLRWKTAMIMILGGVFITMELYEHYIGVKVSHDTIVSLEYKVVYLLLLLSGMLIIFFKPRQDAQDLLGTKNEYLGEQIQNQRKELESLINLKNEFLRNLTHELHTPVTGITSMAQALWQNYDQLSKIEQKDNLKIIAQSAERFNSYTDAILSLAKVSSTNFELTMLPVNLSDLLLDRMKVCMRMYSDGKNLEFITEIDPDIIHNCDKYYMQLVFDNLIINAINYSKEGNITIKFKKHDDKIEFSIKDEGIGIPIQELHSIFEAFAVSSKTKTPAGGRGVGLALVKKSLEAHNGIIWAESNGTKGSIFRFEITAT